MWILRYDSNAIEFRKMEKKKWEKEREMDHQNWKDELSWRVRLSAFASIVQRPVSHFTYHEQGTFHWWFPLSRELDQRLWFNNARETDEKTRSRSFRTVRTSAGHGALLCALLCSTMFNVRTRPAFLPFPIIPFLLWPHSHAPFFCFFLQRQFLIQA